MINSVADRPETANDALSDDELATKIVGLAGRLASATCRWLLLVAQFDAAAGFDRYLLPSTARWLSHYCGLSRRTAIEHVRVARALAAFPALAEAMSSGRLSYSHVRAISRLAHDGESRLVDDLIEIAQNGTVGQLEATVRGLRTVEDNETPPGIPPEYLAHSWSSESQWRMNTRLDPEHGTVVQSAIEAVARKHGVPMAEALRIMAEQTLAAMNDAGRPPRTLRGDERAAVVIHLNVADLRRDSGATRPDERSAERVAPTTRRRPDAHVAGGPGLPRAVIERLLCSGRIRTAIHDPIGNVRDLGRSHRLVTDRQYRALLVRHGGCCSVPGCGSTTNLEAHHVRAWIAGGRTDLANLVLLCEGHHLGHHRGAFTIQAIGSGQFGFRTPDGRDLPLSVITGDHTEAVPDVESTTPQVAGDAATTRWTGEPIDLQLAISILAERRAAELARAG